MIKTKARKHKIDLITVFSVLMFTTSAMDRIDFLCGKGSFKLTPTVIFSVAFLAVYGVNIVLIKGKIVFSSNLYDYYKALMFLTSTVILSGLFSADFLLSFKRIIMFIINTSGGFLAIDYIYRKYGNEIKNILVKCIIVQFFFHFIAFILDELMWQFSNIHQFIMNNMPFYSKLSMYGTYIVRCKGLCGDANRAGIFLVFCIIILADFCQTSIIKNIVIGLCTVMVLLTISRTSILCLMLALILKFFQDNRKFFRIKKRVVFKLLIYSGLILVIIIRILKVPFIQNAISILMERFVAPKDTSGVTHIKLISYGINLALSNLKIALIGNGYGASYTILEEFFHDNKYANFHNGYISFLVECGIISLLSFVNLLLKPLFNSKSCMPFIMVLALTNVSYQIHTEQYIWVLMPLFCLPLFDSKKQICTEKTST